VSKPYEISQVSLQGNRPMNQDRCALFETKDGVLIILADGMGGHPKGEEAAQLVIDACYGNYLNQQKPVVNPAEMLREMLSNAHQSIYSFGQQQKPPIDPRSTAVVVLVQNGLVYWAHIGDSRFYHCRQGQVFFRTTDHSYVERLRRQGLITEEQLSTHPQRNYVTRCVGGSQATPQADIGGPVVLEYGDVLLLCSDGLWGPIPQEDVASAVSSDAPLYKISQELAHLAVQTANPESDNVTLAALRWLAEAVPEPAKAASPDKKKSAQNDDDNPLDQAIHDLRNFVDEWGDEKT